MSIKLRIYLCILSVQAAYDKLYIHRQFHAYARRTANSQISIKGDFQLEISYIYFYK